MISVSKAYRVFSSKVYRITMNIMSVILGLFQAFVIVVMYLSEKEGQAMQESIEGNVSKSLGIVHEGIIIPLLVTTALMELLIVFADYFVFVGISARHTGTMAALRSSYYGTEVIRKGIAGDHIANLIRSFIAGPLPAVVFTVVFDISNKTYTILMVLAVWGGLIFTIGVVNLVVRRFAKSIIAMIFFSYIGIAVFGIVAVVATVVMYGINAGLVPVWMTIICAIVFWLLAVVLMLIVKNEALKGYKSGFVDKMGE